jgi:hypothetical protein
MIRQVGRDGSASETGGCGSRGSERGALPSRGIPGRERLAVDAARGLTGATALALPSPVATGTRRTLALALGARDCCDAFTRGVFDELGDHGEDLSGKDETRATRMSGALLRSPAFAFVPGADSNRASVAVVAPWRFEQTAIACDM